MIYAQTRICSGKWDVDSSGFCEKNGLPSPYQKIRLCYSLKGEKILSVNGLHCSSRTQSEVKVKWKNR